VVLLSPLSAQLLKLCDGERTVSEIANRLPVYSVTHPPGPDRATLSHKGRREFVFVGFYQFISMLYPTVCLDDFARLHIGSKIDRRLRASDVTVKRNKSNPWFKRGMLFRSAVDGSGGLRLP
jgi:hypothetical protein